MLYLIIPEFQLERVCVEAFRLNERGKRELTPYGEGVLVQFASIDFECAIATIYEDVEFEK